MKILSQRKKWSRKGVSDLIGNMLILAITVTLFSSILWFVASMPGPSEKVYTDFSSHVDKNSATGVVWLNVTNKGGQPLGDYKTSIYLFVNGVPTTLHLSNSMSPSPIVNTTDHQWSTGEIFTYKVTGVTSSTTLRFMVVDTEANTVVWDSVLIGSPASPDAVPIIGTRGTSPEAITEGTEFRFYATVIDPYGHLDMNSVYVDGNAVGLGLIKLTDANNDTVFWSDSSLHLKLTAANDGAIVLLNATDTNGKGTMAQLTLHVLSASGGGTAPGPFQNYPEYYANGTYPPDASGGEAGGDVGITFYYIRHMSDNSIGRTFNDSEQVVVEVYSNTLSNLGLQNSFYLYHPITGLQITPPSSNLAFQYVGTFGSFIKYEMNFTAPSDSYIYPIQIKLKDSRGVSVNLVDSISVQGGNYPKIITAKLVGSSLVPTTQFNHTDTMYLLVYTKDVDWNAASVYVSDVEVDDYSGAFVIKKAPASYTYPPTYNEASKPLSSLFKTNGASPTPMGENTSTGVYTMYIGLKDAYQSWWLPKTNFYTIKIATISDAGSHSTTGEVYHSLSAQFQVTAPVSTMDIAATIGSGSFTWSASGAAWSQSRVSWFKGGDQWDETVVDPSPNNGPVTIVVGDINGDGRNDMVVGSQDQIYSNIVWYENQKPDGSSWSSGRSVSLPFDANSGEQAVDSSTAQYTNINEDATLWSTASSDRYIVNYNGNHYVCNNELCGALAVGDFDGDGDGDIVASFVHVVVYSSATSSGSADYTNSYGIYFSRGIYIFWNDGNWTRTTLYSSNDWISGNAANSNTNPAAMDLAVGDFNKDGYDDIVAVYEGCTAGTANGDTKVWINQWPQLSGSINSRETNAFGTAASLRTLPQVAGTRPWDHVQYTPKVRVADMNGDGYPDIVRSSTGDKSITIFYTYPSALDTVYYGPTAEYQINSERKATVVSGSMANLNETTPNHAYETLKEVYVNYNPLNATCDSKDGRDTTGEPLSDLATIDGTMYSVAPVTTMYLPIWTIPAQYMGCDVTKAILKIDYSADSVYSKSTNIEYSTDGVTWTSTLYHPQRGDSGVYVTYDLLAHGIRSWNALHNLQVRFQNTDTSGYVNFDYVTIEMTFVKTRELGRVWEIPNDQRAFHVLTFTGRTSGTTPGEGFLFQYSTDGDTWFDCFTVTATADTTYTCNLTYTPNSKYFVRAIDTNNLTSDVANDTLYLDQLVIKHFAQSVTWDSSHTYKITSFTAPDYITGIAIGDMKRQMGTAAGLPDIVVCTAKVDATNTLWILRQTGGAGGYTPTIVVNYVPTPELAIMCPDPAAYDAHAVEVGDIDGDVDLDIILVVGMAPGRDPGTGPTLWQYMNKGFTSQWNFDESYVNQLATKGESAVNARMGYIDFSILIPFLSMAMVVASNGLVEMIGKRRK